MRRPKEKPVGGKPKALEQMGRTPKELGRLLKKQYLARRVQRQPEERPNEYAADKVETTAGGVAGYAADTAAHGVQHVRQKHKQETQRRRSEDKRTETAPEHEHGPESREPAQAPAERVNCAAERPGNTMEAPAINAPKEKKRELAAARKPHGRAAAMRERGQHTPAPKERKRPTVTGKGTMERQGKSATTRTAQKSAARVRQHLKRRAAKNIATGAVHQTQAAARAGGKAAVAAKHVTVAVVKAAAALIGSLVSFAGVGILLVVLVVVIVIAAIANSPFGLFFAAEKNAPDTVSVAQAVATVNMAYNAKLEELQAGEYDDVVVHGQGPDWPDVLAVFAVRTAGADVEGMDVATLDAARVDKLTVVFWDMTAISTEVETINYPSDGEDEPARTERILHITITAKTADDMRAGFTAYQNSALDELLANRAALSSLAGDLTITNADLADILKNLPTDLSPERREVVRTALQLVGKVNYFWGGKSYAIGWDSRWGTLQKVWAAGSSTTGTYRPFGLDCSGFVDWVFNNAMNYIPGHGGGASAQHAYCTDIPWTDAQPGDLAFFPDDSHVGIVVGRSGDGDLLVCHCSYSQNNVVVTDCATTGFSAIGRPDVLD